MDAESAGTRDPDGKLHYLPREGMWYVHCKWCEKEAWLEARDEDEAYVMLKEWRLSMPGKKSQKRNWSCATCAQYFQDTTPTATDTAGSARQLGEAAATLLCSSGSPLFDALDLEVQQLKAEVVELKAEVEKWKELVPRHVAYKAAHVDELRKLRQEIDKLRAEATAAQNPPPASPPASPQHEPTSHVC